MLDSKAPNNPPPTYTPPTSAPREPSYDPYRPSPAPQPQPQQSPHYPASGPTAKSPSQIGEEYRAGLYAQCAQGNHQRKTEYGVCGIITAVILFPIGLICLCIDRDHKCERCGVRLN